MSVVGGVLPTHVWDRGSVKAGGQGVGKVLGRCALQLDREGVSWHWEIAASQLKCDEENGGTQPDAAQFGGLGGAFATKNKYYLLSFLN